MGDILAQFKSRSNVNLLLNGAFEFDQEKEGGVYTVNGSYCLDQFIQADATSCIRAAVTTNPYGFVLRSTATADQNRYAQRLEQKAVKNLKVGSKLTFSIYAQVISGAWSATPVTLRVDYANAVDNFSGVTNVVQAQMSALTGTNIPDGTRRRFFHTFTVTQQMIDNGIQIGFGDLGTATNVVEYSMVMLNEGEHRAPFSRAGGSFEGETLKIERFYEKSYNLGVAVGSVSILGSMFGRGPSLGTSVSNFGVRFATRKRGTPAVAAYSTVTGAVDTIRNQTTTADLGATYSNTGETGFIPQTGGFDGEDIFEYQWVANARL